jgi:hypothetical protein
MKRKLGLRTDTRESVFLFFNLANTHAPFTLSALRQTAYPGSLRSAPPSRGFFYLESFLPSSKVVAGHIIETFIPRLFLPPVFY